MKLSSRDAHVSNSLWQNVMSRQIFYAWVSCFWKLKAMLRRGSISMKIKSRRDGIYAGHEAEVGTFLYRVE